MSGPADSAATGNGRASVFLRLEEIDAAPDGRLAATLIEVDVEGYIPREVGLAKDGTLLHVTRPGEYGQWNDRDSGGPPLGTPAFDEAWGVKVTPVSADTFEAIFAKADATLPRSVGLTRQWVSDVVSWVILLAVVAARGRRLRAGSARLARPGRTCTFAGVVGSLSEHVPATNC